MNNPNHYPDLPADTLGDLKRIVRLPRMKGVAPKICFGDVYNSWPVERRLSYAERLASSMNHAADVLQQERNALIVVMEKQEAQIKHSTKQYVAQGETMHRELAAQDAEKQQLYQQIVSLQRELKEKNKRIQAAREVLNDQH